MQNEAAHTNVIQYIIKWVRHFPSAISVGGQSWSEHFAGWQERKLGWVTVLQFKNF